jgi:hypothetical protein
VARVEASVNAKDIGAVLDGDIITRWHAVPQTGGETILVTLERPQHVSGVVLSLGAYAGQYPSELAIDVSTDGESWTPAFRGGTALQTYDAAIRSPREIPLELPVQRDAVKVLRLRQTGRDPRRGWTIVELRVIG